jgi:hypothetical protein
MISEQPIRVNSTVGRLAVLGLGLRATQFLLRTIGFRRTVRMLGSMTPCNGERSPSSQIRLFAEIDRVTIRPRSPSCLDRSVLLWFALRLHGIDSDIRIGVSPSGDTIDGHAWVELDGKVLNDDEDVAQHFAVFDGDPIGLAFS